MQVDETLASCRNKEAAAVVVDCVVGVVAMVEVLVAAVAMTKMEVVLCLNQSCRLQFLLLSDGVRRSRHTVALGVLLQPRQLHPLSLIHI